MPPIPYHATALDGREVAQHNELAVLRAVRLFGHLRRSELAMAVWPRTSLKSARNMCQLTVQRMLTSGLLLERPNILGGRSLVLAAKGVSRLRDNGVVDALEGYDLSGIAGGQFFHRTLGTCYLLECARNHASVFGEYALVRGYAPLTREFFALNYDKVPDGLVFVPGQTRGYDNSITCVDWVEVESAYKPDEELQKIVALALKVGEYLSTKQRLLLDRVVFVYDTRQRHEAAIQTALVRSQHQIASGSEQQVLESVRMVRAHVSFPLVWRGCTELSAWKLITAPEDTRDPTPDFPTSTQFR